MTIDPQPWRARLCIAVSGLVGCQAPFGVDRHDLVGDRIAAITTAWVDDATVQASAWLVVDGHAWAPTAVEASWFAYVGEATAAAVDEAGGTPVAVGATASLPVRATPASFVLVVTFPSGVERRALITYDGDAPAYPAASVELGTVNLDFDEATPEDFEARAALVPEPATAVPVSAWARLSLVFDGEAPASFARARWMNTRLDTTFLELSDRETDWATGVVVLDDLEIESTAPAAAGVTTLLTLAEDRTGMHRAWVRELWIGDPAPGLVTRGRWIGADLGDLPASGRVAGTLEADDDAPTGLRLASAAVVGDAEVDPDDPWGTAALGCGPGGPFDPTWLFDGACARDQVLGARVVVEVP